MINSDDEDKAHVVILSNRLKATAVTIGSVCRSSKKKIHFHVISTDKEEFEGFFNKLSDCRDSELELQTIDQATSSLLELGFTPIWWQVENKNVDAAVGDKSEWGIQTPYTDDKHAHALNLLRFYLPYLPSLSGVNKFIFLDDDVILQRDIEEMLDLDIQPGVAMLAGCQHWKWNGEVDGNFETTWNMTVKETGYMGSLQEICDSSKEQQYGCTRAGLEHELSSLTQLYDPKSKFADRPLDRQAFNMGLNVFDTKAWKDLQLSHRFEQWVGASNKLKLFPHDTLAFGLGLAYLALGDTVQCYEPGSISHLVGLGFVSEESLAGAGWPLKKISEDAYALHYNGANKPWDDVQENSACAKETPTDLLEMWKKTCEDVGVCSCEKSGDLALGRRHLQQRNEYTPAYLRNRWTKWLNNYQRNFKAEAPTFSGDTFCGLQTNFNGKEKDCTYRAKVCDGPLADDRYITDAREDGRKITCTGNGVLFGLSSNYLGESNTREFSATCATYNGWRTNLCYWTNPVIKAECGPESVLTGMQELSEGLFKVQCCRWSV